MIIYLLLGTIWAAWLEHYTTKHLEGTAGQSWSMKERIFHIAVWPVNLLIFIYNIFKGL